MDPAGTKQSLLEKPQLTQALMHAMVALAMVRLSGEPLVDILLCQHLAVSTIVYFVQTNVYFNLHFLLIEAFVLVIFDR